MKTKHNVPPFSHNLGYLARESNIYEQLSENQKNLFDKLEPLNIESRYPDYKKKVFESLNYEKCHALLEQVKELHLWFLSRL